MRELCRTKMGYHDAYTIRTAELQAPQDDDLIERLCLDPKQRYLVIVTKLGLDYDLGTAQATTEAEALAAHEIMVGRWARRLEGK